MTFAPWHDEAWRLLDSRRRGGTLPHALLLAGAAGLGKREFAAAFAAGVLCQNPRADGSACGECRACRLVAAGSHPDLITIGLELRDDGKPRTEIIVDQIRALSERIAMTAQFGGMQLARIDPADSMNASAANALLKTLEEPTPASLIVLVADQPARLPATIRSRCQRITLQAPARAQALEWFRGQGIDSRAAETALQASGGNPGLALRWLRDGGLDVRAEVLADLRALCGEKTSPVAVANRWGKADAGARLWFAAALLRDEADARARGAPGPLALTPRPDFTKLSNWFDQANRARELLRGPLRAELVVLEALSGMAPGANAAR
jgi:DNA polymerase III subunit delta'